MFAKEVCRKGEVRCCRFFHNFRSASTQTGPHPTSSAFSLTSTADQDSTQQILCSRLGKCRKHHVDELSFENQRTSGVQRCLNFPQRGSGSRKSSKVDSPFKSSVKDFGWKGFDEYHMLYTIASQIKMCTRRPRCAHVAKRKICGTMSFLRGYTKMKLFGLGCVPLPESQNSSFLLGCQHFHPTKISAFCFLFSDSVSVIYLLLGFILSHDQFLAPVLLV